MIDVTKEVLKRQKWEAEKLTQFIQKVPYLGPKTSRLAVRWLDEIVEELDIDMTYYKVPIDRNIDVICPKLFCDIDPVKEGMIRYQRETYRTCAY